VLLGLDGAWNSEKVIDEGNLQWVGIEYPLGGVCRAYKKSSGRVVSRPFYWTTRHYDSRCITSK
jgi:hypothetical protein